MSSWLTPFSAEILAFGQIDKFWTNRVNTAKGWGCFMKPSSYFWGVCLVGGKLLRAAERCACTPCAGARFVLTFLWVRKQKNPLF